VPLREQTTGDHPIELVVEPEEASLRLDQFLQKRLSGISRGSIRRLVERRQVLVEGQHGAKGVRLQAGQQVVVASVAKSERPVPQPELPLELVAVRPEMVVVNKAPGMACHPLVPGETDTVANALAARFPECVLASPQPREGGLVHRLDWSTSGLLLAARSPAAYGRLRGMFSARQVVKHYLALVEGNVTGPGSVESGLRTMPGDRTRMQVVFPAEEREAETAFEPLRQLGAHTLLHVVCNTGHRHQVRVHLAHAGHPLAGDAKYGGEPLEGSEGAFLHAARIELLEPALVFSAPLPRERLELLRRMGASTKELETWLLRGFAGPGD
jgi:23S rRNA pseudouridine1911/1915/1917 synthase